jgi:hypothetical protein
MISKVSALCTCSRGHLHPYFRQPNSRVQDRSAASHQTCHRRHHDNRQSPRPTRIHPCTSDIETARPRCATPPRLGVVDVVDEHHSTSYLHHPAAVPKTMPLRRRATQSIAITRYSKPRSMVPLVQHELVDEKLHQRCLLQGNDAWTSPSPAMTVVKARFSQVVLPPQLAAGTRCGILIRHS